MGNHQESSESPSYTSTPTTPSQPNPHHKSILCPRCGYNLRGITQTWDEKSACPLTGKCSECGLDFDWQRVFRDSEHPWLFEKQWRNHPRYSFIQTTLKSFRPDKFWREVELVDQIHLGPLFVLPLIILLFLFMLRFGVSLWSYNTARTAFATWNLIGGTFSFTGFLNYWSNHSSWAWNGEIYPLFGWITINSAIWTLLMIVYFGLMLASLNQYQVRKNHLVRVGAYTFVPLIIYITVWAIADIIFIFLGQFLGIFIDNITHVSLKYMFIITFTGWFIWQIICWCIACKTYLKLPHSFWIALLLTTASGLTLLLAHILWWNYQVQIHGVDVSKWQYQLFAY